MVKQKKKRKIDLLFITACISTSLVLLLIGIVALLLLTASDLSRHLKQEMTVEVILKESITDTQLSTLRRSIEASPYCAVCSYISKDDALKDMTKGITDFVLRANVLLRRKEWQQYTLMCQKMQSWLHQNPHQQV